MLTEAEQDRLVEDLPLADVGVEVLKDGDKETHTYDVTPYWHGSDHLEPDGQPSPDYPALVLEPDTMAELNDPNPVDGALAEIDERPGESVIEERYEHRVSNDISLTVAVRAAHDGNGVAPQTRAKGITRQLIRYLRHDIDLNETGENGERPMVVQMLDSPTPSRVERTLRVEWQIRVRYVEEHIDEITAVADAEYEVDANN